MTINDALKKLSFREREIIKLRYGIGTGYTYTLEEVGRIFKVTRERVRQIEARAVEKLRRLEIEIEEVAPTPSEAPATPRPRRMDSRPARRSSEASR